ncbi:MAG: heme ABC transporter permease CcmC [Vibrionaceae bacterium]
MWQLLHRNVTSNALYHFCQKLVPWFAVLACITLLTGTIWGLIFAPADYQQGDSFRIIYLHVPTAIGSMIVYLAMAIVAFIGLVWQSPHAHLSVAAMAPIGAVYTFLTLVTGSLWGKPMWGIWWVWDARLTSELVLLLLYLGVMVLSRMFADQKKAAKAAAILATIGVINLPIIHFSVQWWNTLHQGATLTTFSKPLIDSMMLWPLLINIVGVILFFICLFLMSLTNKILHSESNQAWVRDLII